MSKPFRRWARLGCVRAVVLGSGVVWLALWAGRGGAGQTALSGPVLGSQTPADGSGTLAGPNSSSTAYTPVAPLRRFYRGSEGLEISLGSFSQVTASRNPGSTTVYGATTVSTQSSQSATPSAGLLATVRQSFGPLLGFNVNVGYTRFVENYTSGTTSYGNATGTMLGSTFSRGSIRSSAVELTGAYVMHGPRSRSRFTPFAQLGGGFLAFVPDAPAQPVSYVYRGAGLAGLGVSLRMGQRLELRAEERVLFFKSPDFRYGAASGSSLSPQPAIPVLSRYTTAQEPALSLSYRFGGPRRGLQ